MRLGRTACAAPTRFAALTAWQRWGSVVLVVGGCKRVVMGEPEAAPVIVQANRAVRLYAIKYAYDQGYDDGVLIVMGGGADEALLEIEATMADAEHPLRRSERTELRARAAGLCDAALHVAASILALQE